jgi:hypothetical protein
VRQLPLFASRVPGVTMQTTGLTRERMTELYEADRLSSALHDARRRTLAFYAHLDLSQLRVPYLATSQPAALGARARGVVPGVLVPALPVRRSDGLAHAAAP